jgi:hypothetical protein
MFNLTLGSTWRSPVSNVNWKSQKFSFFKEFEINAMAKLKKPGTVTVVELNFQLTLASRTSVHFQPLCCGIAYIWIIAPNWAGFMTKKLFCTPFQQKKNRTFYLIENVRINYALNCYVTIVRKIGISDKYDRYLRMFHRWQLQPQRRCCYLTGNNMINIGNWCSFHITKNKI